VWAPLTRNPPRPSAATEPAEEVPSPQSIEARKSPAVADGSASEKPARVPEKGVPSTAATSRACDDRGASSTTTDPDAVTVVPPVSRTVTETSTLPSSA